MSASPPRPASPGVGATDRGRTARAARAAVIAPIAVYRRVISPGLPRRCRYEPTCSRYAAQAIREYGILRGLVLAVWRLLRCNPWSPGGFDPVGAQRVFGAHPPGTHPPTQAGGRRTPASSPAPRR
jgi:putative membrane protein insertion efficiency factor